MTYILKNYTINKMSRKEKIELRNTMLIKLTNLAFVTDRSRCEVSKAPALDNDVFRTPIG